MVPRLGFKRGTKTLESDETFSKCCLFSVTAGRCYMRVTLGRNLNSFQVQLSMPSTARTDVVLPMTDDYMQQIVRGEKNYEFRKYRIAPTVSTSSPRFSIRLGTPKLNRLHNRSDASGFTLMHPSLAFLMFAR